MKLIVIRAREEVDPELLDECVVDIEGLVETMGFDFDILVEEDDTEKAAEFNRLMTDIENEEAGISWQVSP